MPYSRGSSWCKDQTRISCGSLPLSHQGSPWWPHFSPKALSPKTVIFWGPASWGFNTWIWQDSGGRGTTIQPMVVENYFVLSFPTLKGDDRAWHSWMASPTQWIRVWASSRSWWWTGRPGVLQSMGSQRVGHDSTTELNWTEHLKESLHNYTSSCT